MVGNMGSTRRLGQRLGGSVPDLQNGVGVLCEAGTPVRQCPAVRGIQGWLSPLPPAPSLTQTLNLREGTVQLGPS